MLPINFNQIAVPAQSVITSHSLSVALETKEQKIVARPARGRYLSRKAAYTMYVDFGIKEHAVL